MCIRDRLIGKAVSYANEHYPESIYIFADENKPERPISYQTLQDKVLRMIYEDVYKRQD